MTDPRSPKPLSPTGVDPELLELVQPFDSYNQILLDNVHPPEWINPEPQERYHLAIQVWQRGAVITADVK